MGNKIPGKSPFLTEEFREAQADDGILQLNVDMIKCFRLA